MYEAIIVTMGSRDRKDQARVAYVEPGAELDDGTEKAWALLSELRPVPPEPPSGWMRRLMPYDVISALLPGGDGGWVDVAFHELLMPTRDDEALQAEVLTIGAFAKHKLAEASLRPLWSLADESRAWSMLQRRSGPRSVVLLTFKHTPAADGGASSSSAAAPPTWSLEGQLTLRGSEAARGEDGEPPAKIDKAATKAAESDDLVTVMLAQQDGSWSFAGDGTAAFTPPLAPLPVDTAAPQRWNKGDKVEVGATDEGYVGSWYAGQIAAVSGGEAGKVLIQYDTLENGDGTPLTEWQPRSSLRPPPPGMMSGVWPPAHFADGDPLQLWCADASASRSRNRRQQCTPLLHPPFLTLPSSPSLGLPPLARPRYNEGWWECVVVPAPEQTKKEAKERKKASAEHQAAVEAARAAGEAEPPLPAALATTSLCVKFLHYLEVHPNIEPSAVRPSWVYRTGEWYWRVKGGVLQYLTTRMADGKTSREGCVQPTWKRGLPWPSTDLPCHSTDLPCHSSNLPWPSTNLPWPSTDLPWPSHRPSHRLPSGVSSPCGRRASCRRAFRSTSALRRIRGRSSRTASTCPRRRVPRRRSGSPT